MPNSGAGFFCIKVVTQIVFNTAITGAIYVLCALSLTLVVRATGKFSFAVGYIAIASGYFYLAFGFWGALLCSFILGSFHYKFALKPFHSMLLPLVATMAFGMIIESLISLFFGVEVKSMGINSESVKIFGGYITFLQIYLVLVATIISLLTLYAFRFTRWGLILKAGPLSQSLGINTDKVSFLTVLSSALIAGVAGFFIGADTNLSPTMGGFYSLKAFAVVVIGGVGSIGGCMLGGIFLALVEQLVVFVSIGDFSLPSSYKDAASFVILLLVLLFKPEGLFNIKRRSV